MSGCEGCGGRSGGMVSGPGAGSGGEGFGVCWAVKSVGLGKVRSSKNLNRSGAVERLCQG